jgi:hypothetical protein
MHHHTYPQFKPLGIIMCIFPLVLGISCQYFIHQNIVNQLTRISDQSDQLISIVNTIQLESEDSELRHQWNEVGNAMHELRILQTELLTTMRTYEPTEKTKLIRDYYFADYKPVWMELNNVYEEIKHVVLSKELIISRMMALDQFSQQLNHYRNLHNEWISTINTILKQ